MMNNKYMSLVVLSCYFAFAKAQPAFYNYGNIKIHPSGSIGFHTDVVNDGNSNDNEGIAGFYNTESSLTFSGNNAMSFDDLEVAVDNDLQMLTSIVVDNVITFTSGRVVTPRDDTSVRLSYFNDGIYIDENPSRHVDGFVDYRGSDPFFFPIGDDFELKPLGISNIDDSFRYVSAYFKENPNNPSFFTTSFDTSSFESSLDIISSNEFWYLESTSDIDISLTWTLSSNVNLLASQLSELRIVAWDEENNQWVNLGNTGVSGDESMGTITASISNSTVYNIYTIGSVLKAGSGIVVYNAITPDGDGMNDTLVITGIENLDNNELLIYNRWGHLVYRRNNYDNTFNGKASQGVVYQKDKSLPSGTYFYVLRIPNQESISGYLYINN